MYQWQDGANISFPSSHPCTVPIQDGLGVSAWFLAHSTPCILTGECVIAHVYVFCTPTTEMTGISLLAHLHTPCMTPQGGTDTASSLFPASLLPSSEASADCSQGQAKEGKRALQLKDCCQPCPGSLLPPASKRGSAEHPCVIYLFSASPGGPCPGHGPLPRCRQLGRWSSFLQQCFRKQLF